MDITHNATSQSVKKTILTSNRCFDARLGEVPIFGDQDYAMDGQELKGTLPLPEEVVYHGIKLIENLIKRLQ